MGGAVDHFVPCAAICHGPPHVPWTRPPPTVQGASSTGRDPWWGWITSPEHDTRAHPRCSALHCTCYLAPLCTIRLLGRRTGQTQTPTPLSSLVVPFSFTDNPLPTKTTSKTSIVSTATHTPPQNLFRPMHRICRSETPGCQRRTLADRTCTRTHPSVFVFAPLFLTSLYLNLSLGPCAQLI